MNSSLVRLPARYVLFWDQKLVRALGGVPWVAGVIISTAAFTSFLLLAWGFGIYELLSDGAIPNIARTFGMDPYTWAALISSLLTGFGFSATAFTLLMEEKDLKEVAPLVGYDQMELADKWLGFLRARVVKARIISAVFFVLGMATVILNVPGAADVFRLNEPALYPWYQQVPAAWLILFVPLNFSLIAKGAYFTMAEERFQRRLRAEGLKIELFHPERLAPFTRIALRRSFLWIVGSSICLLLFFNEAVSPSGLLPFITLIVAVAVITLVAPLTSIHRAIVATKARELSEARTLIVELKDLLVKGRGVSGDVAQRLSGLLAYEARLEKVPEWPIDLPTIGKFSLYLGIPVFSWVGGALMERLVNALV